MTAFSSSQEEFISIQEIYSGMEGIGKTVFSGTEIEEFAVKVIDVIAGTVGNDDSYILAKLSGEKIDGNGGISAGMSGSPVYLEGKLAGAVSYTWEMSEHNLCLITPIQYMLSLLGYTDNNDTMLKHTFSPNIRNPQNVSVFIDDDLGQRISKNIDKPMDGFLEGNFSPMRFKYMQSPLILMNGLKGRSVSILKKSLWDQGNFSIQQISEYQDHKINTPMGNDELKIKPGSAIGVQLSCGDVNILTIGTATYRKGNQLLALGHPFMHHGEVSYLLSAVYIYHSFPSMVMPFKLGSSYKLLGEVTQDRNAGILAQLNQFPQVITCKIKVSDLDRNVEIESGAKVIPQNDIVQSVLSSLVVQAIDRGLDRIGQGTANLYIDIKGKKTEERIMQKNIHFSKDDIAIQCNQEINELFALIVDNYSKKMEFNEIKVNIDISRQNKSAVLKQVKLDKQSYLPGDMVQVDMTIKPFRQPEQTKTGEIKIPEAIVSGEVLIIVGGANSTDVIGEEIIQQEEEVYLLDGWDGIQKYLKEKTKNNQIMIEIIPVNEQEELTKKKQGDLSVQETPYKEFLDTDFVIEGYHELFFTINPEKDHQDEDQLNG